MANKLEIQVEFLNRKEERVKNVTQYHYLIDQDVLFSLIIQISDWSAFNGISDFNNFIEYCSRTNFIIINKEGHNYGRNPVIITGLRKSDETEAKIFKEIINFEEHSYCNYTTVPRYGIDVCNFDRKVIDDAFASLRAKEIFEKCSVQTTNALNTTVPITCTSDVLNASGTDSIFSTYYAGGGGYYNVANNPYQGIYSPLTFTSSSTDCLSATINNKKEKEEKNMFENVMKNFEFGPCGDEVKMSIYGLSFKSENNEYVAFKNDKPIDVTGMTFDFNCVYKMPVAFSEVKTGEYIYHKKHPVKVVEKNNSRGNLICVDLFNKEEVTVIPVENMFGFNYFTKVVCFGENLFKDNMVNEENPFGSMFPLMLLMGNNSSTNKVNQKNDSNLLLAAMLMQNDKKMDNNMMLMAMMMSNNGNNEMLPLLMMMGTTDNKKKKKSEE